MKKNILKIGIFLLCIIVFISSCSYASTFTKQDFINELNKAVYGNVRVNITDREIEILPLYTDTEYCTISYNLSENPIFTTQMEFDDKMTFDEYTDESTKITYFAYLLKAFKSNLKKDIGEYPAIYMLGKIYPLMESENVHKSNWTNDIGISMAKQDYKDKMIDDDAFKLTFETLEDTSSKLKFKVTFEPKLKDEIIYVKENNINSNDKALDELEQNNNLSNNSSNDNIDKTRELSFSKIGVYIGILILIPLIIILSSICILKIKKYKK